MFKSIVLTSLLALSGTAYAAADVAVTVTPPTGKHVYESGRYNVRVRNIGNRDAASVVVTITLPRTNTSPQVYVMGTVGALASGCTRSSNVITCTYGTVRKNNAFADKWFDLTLPQNATPLSITARVTTTSVQNSGSAAAANDTTTVTPSLLNYAVAFSELDTATNDHCTGTGLTSYYECTLFPSSISSHETVLNDDGSITFVGQPGYGGSWWQASPDHLHFVYEEIGAGVVAEFDGEGVSTDCFEGVTTFPGSTYVSPYQVCFQ